MIVYAKGMDNDIYMRHIKEFAKANPRHRFTSKEERNADVVLTEELSTEEIGLYPKLKAVFAPIVGKNKFAVKELERREIKTFFIEGTPEIVAEHALALALAVMGKIALHDRNMKERDSWSFDDSYWDSLFGAKAAILGAGRIGGMIASYLRPFKCDITAFDKRSRECGGLFDRTTDDLREAISGAEVIFAALELNDETFHIIGKEELELMKGAYLINIARAELVDEEALDFAVKNCLLKGFAADPWYEYPASYPEGGSGACDDCAPSRFDFYKSPRVVCTPHTGTQTLRAREVYISQILRRLESYLNAG